MLTNPKCPSCDTNKRVIASYKATKQQAMQGMYLFDILIPSQQYLYSCNSCKTLFKGHQSCVVAKEMINET